MNDIQRLMKKSGGQMTISFGQNVGVILNDNDSTIKIINKGSPNHVILESVYTENTITQKIESAIGICKEMFDFNPQFKSLKEEEPQVKTFNEEESEMPVIPKPYKDVHTVEGRMVYTPKRRIRRNPRHYLIIKSQPLQAS